MKKLLRLLESYPNIAILPSAILFAGSVYFYSQATVFIEENKLGSFWQTIIVMTAVLIMVITGILFFGIISRAIANLFKRNYRKIVEKFARKKERKNK